MSANTLAEYRNLFKVRHGVACPLTDAQMRTALAAASPSAVLEDEFPFDLTGLTAIEASVASNYASTNISRYQHGGNLLMGTLALDNATVAGFDVNFAAATGGNPAYSYQLQLLNGETWVNKGAAQADTTEIVLDDLEADTSYSARVKVTDQNGEIAYSNTAVLATSAA